MMSEFQMWPVESKQGFPVILPGDLVSDPT